LSRGRKRLRKWLAQHPMDVYGWFHRIPPRLCPAAPRPTPEQIDAGWGYDPLFGPIDPSLFTSELFTSDTDTFELLNLELSRDDKLVTMSDGAYLFRTAHPVNMPHVNVPTPGDILADISMQFAASNIKLSSVDNITYIDNPVRPKQP
jgi:hypothetical protein